MGPRIATSTAPMAKLVACLQAQKPHNRQTTFADKVRVIHLAQEVPHGEEERKMQPQSKLDATR